MAHEFFRAHELKFRRFWSQKFQYSPPPSDAFVARQIPYLNSCGAGNKLAPHLAFEGY